MTDLVMWSTIMVAAFAGISVISVTTLKGWRDWIGLQRLSIQNGSTGGQVTTGGPSTAARIELADLRERVRKLEAIAAGVDL